MINITVEHVWQEFLFIASKEIGSRAVETWFKAISLYAWDPESNVAYIAAPNQFVKDWIHNNYLQALELHLKRLLCVNQIKICLTIEQLTTQISTKIHSDKIVPHLGYKKEYNNVYQYQFNSFVVDKKNEFTYLAAQAVVQKPGSLYNPLLICGHHGVGKTHLLCAINNTYVNHKKESVLYESVNMFIKEYVASIKTKSMQQFNKKYNSIDVLLIDDLQDIAYKTKSQDALCQIISNLNSIKKQVVFSSSQDPLTLDGITEKLKSYLSSGLITHLFPPSLETKIAIIKNKLTSHYKIDLNDETIQMIAEKNIHGPREIDGLLTKIIAASSLKQKEITTNFIKEILNIDEQKDTRGKYLDSKDILETLKNIYRLNSIDEIISKKRNAQISKVRHIGMYIIKNMLQKSLRETASIFGNRDYTTVKYAITKIARSLATDKTLASEITQIKNQLTEIYLK